MKWLLAIVLLMITVGSASQQRLGAQSACGYLWAQDTAQCYKQVKALDISLVQSPAPWQISKEADSQIQQIFNNRRLSDTEQVLQAEGVLFAARLQSLKPLSRWFVETASEDAQNQQSIYNRTPGRWLGRFIGPHYNSLLNRIYSPRHENQASLARIMTGVHEKEHAVHRNTRPVEFLMTLPMYVLEFFSLVRTPLIPLMVRHKEYQAIGAEWELVHRITPQVRHRLLKTLALDKKKTTDKEAFEILELTEQSLRSAHLPKAKFVEALSVASGYSVKNLLDRYYQANKWKQWLPGETAKPMAVASKRPSKLSNERP